MATRSAATGMGGDAMDALLLVFVLVLVIVLAIVAAHDDRGWP